MLSLHLEAVSKKDGSRVCSFRLRVEGAEFPEDGLGSRLSSKGFEEQGFGYECEGAGFRV